MRTSLKNILRKDIAHIAAIKLRALKRRKLWSYQEISDKTGIHNSRISNLVHKEILSETNLILLIGGGFLTTKEIIKKLRLKEPDQIKYIESFKEYERYA